MLKLFASQRNSAAVLFRACLPSVASWSLGNTHILKDFRRSLSDECHSATGPPDAAPLASKGHYHIWSLMSNQGDALMEIVTLEDQNKPTFKCTGMYNENSSLVNTTDSTVFPTPSVSFWMTLKRKPYYLSIRDEKIVARAFVEGVDQLDEGERFVHLVHGSYSMFESVKHKDHYLGSEKNGTLDLVNVHDKVFPDPRVLFLMHLKLAKNT